jgi:hypothetical protein
LTTSKEVDCGVLLLLTRSFERYASSWDEEKFEIGFSDSGKEADAMPSDFRRLDFFFEKKLDRNKGFIYKRVTTKEADLPALCAMAEDPMNYHQ